MTAKPRPQTETAAEPEAPAEEGATEREEPAAQAAEAPEAPETEAAAAEEAAQAPAAEPDPAAEIAALNDKLLRALAEGENLRRRAQKEREDTAKYAIANFARDMATVADNLRRAVESLPAEARDDDEAIKAFIEGVELTERELIAALERHGVTKVDPLGEKFDHDLHEAMFEVPTNEAEPGTVVQVMEVGYVLNGRLLRAARVGIAKAPPEADAQQRVDTTV